MSNQKIVTETALSAIASDIKTALSGKANSNDVYLKSQTYNRTEIDNALGLKADKNELYNFYPTDQESGAIAHITDGADNIPVKSLVSQIVAVESGSGKKSPENPYSISGFDSGIITRCGKNLFSNSDVRRGIYTNWDGTTSSGNVSTNFSSAFIKCKPSTTYTIEMFDDSYLQGSLNVIYYGEGKQGLNDGTTLTNLSSNTPKTFTTHASAGYFVITGYRSNTNGGTDIFTTAKVLITDSSDITYEAYNGNTYTFAFGQTVYGGHFDNKGNLVVTHGYIASYNGETINEPWISSIDEYVPNTSPSTGAQVVYPLTTPITLSITSQDIPTLLGENNIFSNCGDVEVNYHADIGLYIDKKISSLAQA